jgi:hypothetical protein
MNKVDGASEMQLSSGSVQSDSREDPVVAKASVVRRPDRDGRVPLPFWTKVSARKQLRLLAAEEDSTQQSLMAEALNLLFQSRGKPPLA